jgi:hypothetical protein
MDFAMPAYTQDSNPLTGLVVIFRREGEEIARRVAQDGERAAQMAALLIAEAGELQVGDAIIVEEPAEDMIVEILRAPDGNSP